MVNGDGFMDGLGEAMERGRTGDRAGARARFLRLWEEIGESGDPLHRCAVAHSMADVQDELEAELMWDLRALAAADELSDERVADAGVAGSARSFYPSLHLNLADVNLRLGRRDEARRHVDLGRASIHALAEDGYREMVTGGLDRVQRGLDGVDDRSPPPAAR